MSAQLSRSCRAYVVGVGSLGMLPLAWAAWQLVAQPPHAAWYLLAGLAVLSGPLSIRIPSVQATISVSEGFVFSAALLFGPAAATAIAAIDGLAVSVWSKRRSAVRVLFAVGEPAISVCVASQLFYRAAGVEPLLHHSTAFIPLVLPLAVLTVTYFGLNTLLAGMAVWLDVGGRPLSMLRRHLPHLALDFIVSLSLAAALVQSSGNLTLAALVVLLPMLLASYISSHHVAGRLEDTSRHLAELQRLYDSTVETLAMAIDAKDQVTHGHIRRVQLLSSRLGRALGADDRAVKALEAAALLHDLGKLAVPEHILNKPGPLTQAEYEEMKKHADVGASILSAIDFPFPVVPLVRHHHESWDGSGYPDGLQGADIPLGARILAVVDCYDALTSDRPYRRRMSHEDALQIIRARSGSMYDPSVVEAFVRIDPVAEVDAELRDGSGSPLRRQLARALEVSPRPHPAGAAPISRRGKVAQFLDTLPGHDANAIGRAIASFVPSAIPDSVAALFLVDVSTNRLVVGGMHRGYDARVPESLEIGRGVTGWVGANAQPIANADAELDLGEIAGIARPPLRLCVAAPVVVDGRVAGVLTVYSPYAFSETERLLIESLANGLATVFQPSGELELTPALHPPVSGPIHVY